MIQTATFNHQAAGKQASIANQNKSTAGVQLRMHIVKIQSEMAKCRVAAGTKTVSDEDLRSHGINICPMPCKTVVHPCSATQCIHPA